jgi:8-oxo-dGTP diphosphatase
MENLTPDIRNAVRAVIVSNDRVLLLKKTGGNRGERYALPGGAQNLGETLAQALERECLEEIGSAIEIAALMNVADHFKSRETDPPSIRHMVEFLFRCTVPDDYVAHNGIKPDRSQIDVVWVNPAKLAAMPLYPESLSHWLLEGILHDTALYPGIYLGTIE